jgi:hypothetical protein
VMPLDRMPSVSVGIIVPAGAAYDSCYHWRTETGALRASVRFDAGGYSHGHVQGPRWPCGSWPPPWSTPPIGRTQLPSRPRP